MSHLMHNKSLEYLFNLFHIIPLIIENFIKLLDDAVENKLKRMEGIPL